MDKITSVKLKYDDESYSDEIPISVSAENVSFSNNHSLKDAIGNVDIDQNGSIQSQLNFLQLKKIDNTKFNELSSRVNSIIASSGDDITEIADARIGHSTLYQTIHSLTGSDINLIPFPYASGSTTVSGVTFQVQGDGSILVNGTATKSITYMLARGVEVNSGSYFLSGCPAGGNGNTSYSLKSQLTDKTGTKVVDAGDGVEITVVTQIEKKKNFYIAIKKDYSCNNLIFRPTFYAYNKLDKYDNINTYTAKDDQARKMLSFHVDKFNEILFNSNRSIANVIKKIIGYDFATFSKGYYETFNAGLLNSKTSIFTSTYNFISTKIPVTAGEKIYIKAAAHSGKMRQYAFYDQNYITVANAGTGQNDEKELIVPQGASYLVVNHDLDVSDYYYAIKQSNSENILMNTGNPYIVGESSVS